MIAMNNPILVILSIFDYYIAVPNYDVIGNKK